MIVALPNSDYKRWSSGRSDEYLPNNLPVTLRDVRYVPLLSRGVGQWANQMGGKRGL